LTRLRGGGRCRAITTATRTPSAGPARRRRCRCCRWWSRSRVRAGRTSFRSSASRTDEHTGAVLHAAAGLSQSAWPRSRRPELLASSERQAHQRMVAHRLRQRFDGHGWTRRRSATRAARAPASAGDRAGEVGVQVQVGSGRDPGRGRWSGDSGHGRPARARAFRRRRGVVEDERARRRKPPGNALPSAAGTPLPRTRTDEDEALLTFAAKLVEQQMPRRTAPACASVRRIYPPAIAGTMVSFRRRKARLQGLAVPDVLVVAEDVHVAAERSLVVEQPLRRPR